MTITQDALADGIVLVVEDDPSLREALAAALRSAASTTSSSRPSTR